MVLLKLWPGKSFLWHLIRPCDTASFCKMWAAGDLPPGSVTGLQLVRNLWSEGHGVAEAEVAGELPWSSASEKVSLQVSKATPPSSAALIPGGLKSPSAASFSLLQSWIHDFSPPGSLGPTSQLQGSESPFHRALSL